MRRYDLHVHTTASDGRDTPEEVVRKAHGAGLAGIAITDHETTAGVGAAEAAGAETGVHVVPAVEISCDLGPFECHLIGYFIHWGDGPLEELLSVVRRARVERARAMIGRLRAQGLEVTEHEVVTLEGARAVCRPHIAAVLVAKGYARTVREAIRLYLSKRSPAYVPRLKLTPEEAVDAIRSAGGAPVYAHPALTGMDSVIEDLVPRGLVGLEVHYPDHTPADTRKYAEMAERLHLVATGGSDYHGEDAGNQAALGSVSVPGEVVEQLRARL